MTDKARWFNQTGVCRCGRIAVGILMDEFNSPIGPACKACANKRIEAAIQQRLVNRAERIEAAIQQRLVNRAHLVPRGATRPPVRPEELTKSQMYEMLADAARRTAKMPKKPKENRHV